MLGPREENRKNEIDRALLAGYGSDPIATMENYRQAGIAEVPVPVVEAVDKLRDFSIEQKL